MNTYEVEYSVTFKGMVSVDAETKEEAQDIIDNMSASHVIENFSDDGTWKWFRLKCVDTKSEV